MKKKISLMLTAILIIQILLPILTIIVENGFTLMSEAAVYAVDDSYIINSEQDLWNFASEVNNGNTFEGITIYLNRDIKLSCNKDKQWVPIGNCAVNAGNYADTTTDKNPFGGIFEGAGHIVSGIYIDTSNNFTGFFGYNQGTIKNLTIKDSYIKSTNSYTGGISAYNKRNN